MKKQLWLRPDQAELVIACLRYVQHNLNTGTVLSDAHKMAGRYTYSRISEILTLLESKNAAQARVDNRVVQTKPLADIA